MTTTRLRHSKVELAVHQLRGGAGRPLLHLHGLGERSPGDVPAHLAPWPGPIWALDFTGHGESTVPSGGGYSCEVLMADVDHVLAHLGAVTVFGRGLGGYVALLIAGARPDLVRGAIIADGSGLAGGGPAPGSPMVLPPSYGAASPGTPDPLALVELAHDVRPPDYATTYARLASAVSDLDVVIAACGRNRPEWLVAVLDEPGVVACPLDDALRMFAET